MTCRRPAQTQSHAGLRARAVSVSEWVGNGWVAPPISREVGGALDEAQRTNGERPFGGTRGLATAMPPADRARPGSLSAPHRAPRMTFAPLSLNREQGAPCPRRSTASS
jgi:hypothetical protein